MPITLHRSAAIAAAILLLCTVAPLVAQVAKPITTDRPDFTESSSTVAAGRFQLEAGYTLQHAGTGIASVHSLPEALLRIGLSDRIEGRISQSLSASSGRTDFTDLVLGAKIGIAPQEGTRPEVALLVQSTIPTGGQRVRADRAVPTASLLVGWEIDSRWSAGASVFATREADDHTTLGASVVVGRQLAERWRGFAEWFTSQPVNAMPFRQGEHYLNGGLTHSITPLLQLDARVGVGLGGAADAYFFGLGFAVGW